MAKDPAFLFYYQDFLVGTDHMTNGEVGAYIRCLCHQAHRGSVRPEHMKIICQSHETLMLIREKFQVDPDGHYFNVKLREEITKRRKYTESRRQNRVKHMSNICESHVQHMENENEIVNKDKNNISNIIKESDFNDVWAKYPKKDGRKASLKYFKASVKTKEDLANINKALDNYLKADTVKKGFIKNGSTWFNNWEDWVEVEEKSGIDKYIVN